MKIIYGMVMGYIMLVVSFAQCIAHSSDDIHKKKKYEYNGILYTTKIF